MWNHVFVCLSALAKFSCVTICVNLHISILPFTSRHGARLREHIAGLGSHETASPTVQLRWGLRSLTLSPFLGWWVYQPGDVRDVNVETHHHRKSPEELYPMVIRMDKTIPWTAPGLWAHLEDPAEHIRPFLERDLCSSCSAPNQTCAENTSNLVKCLCRLQQETIEIARLKSEMPEVLNIGSGDIASGFQRWQRSPQPNSYTRGRTSSSDSKAVFSFWSLVCPESKQGSSKLKRCQVILFKTGEGRDVSFQALRFDHVEGI